MLGSVSSRPRGLVLRSDALLRRVASSALQERCEHPLEGGAPATPHGGKEQMQRIRLCRPTQFSASRRTMTQIWQRANQIRWPATTHPKRGALPFRKHTRNLITGALAAPQHPGSVSTPGGGHGLQTRCELCIAGFGWVRFPSTPVTKNGRSGNRFAHFSSNRQRNRDMQSSNDQCQSLLQVTFEKQCLPRTEPRALSRRRASRAVLGPGCSVCSLTSRMI